jgi:hypothetical protein
VVHVIVVILSTITVYGLIEEELMLLVIILSTITVLGVTEEWFMLLLFYCLPLLVKV